MDAVSIGFFLGALAATFLVSRLVLLVIPKNVGFARYLLANGLSLATAVTLSAMGKAKGGPLDWSDSWLYVLAQAVWVTVDLIRANKPQRATQAGDVHPSAPVPAVESDQGGSSEAVASAPGGQTLQAQPVSPKEPSHGELAFWQTIKDSDNTQDFLAYLNQFPHGYFRALACNRLSALGVEPPQANVAPTVQENAAAAPADDAPTLYFLLAIAAFLAFVPLLGSLLQFLSRQ